MILPPRGRKKKGWKNKLSRRDAKRRSEQASVIYRHPQGRFEVIETTGRNAFGGTYSIREAVLTPERDARGLLTDADKYDQNQKTVNRTPLSEEEKETICTLFQDDVSVADIAGYIGRGEVMVRRVLDQRGLRKITAKGRKRQAL